MATSRSTRELSAEVRAHLQDAHLSGAAQHWHFQRRDGAIADQLTAAADDVRRQRGPEAAVVIVVGRSERGYHHVLGLVGLSRRDGRFSWPRTWSRTGAPR